MSKYEREHARYSKKTAETMSGVPELLKNQHNTLKEIKGNLETHAKNLEESFGNLTKALEQIVSEIYSLKNATLSIEKAKAEAIIDTKDKQYRSAEEIWIRARDRFSSQYRKVIADYGKGLEDNVHRFARLVSDELAPMFRINEGSSDFQQIIREMQPQEIDTLRTETAVNMSGMKGSELMDKYQCARESLIRFYEERKALVDRIEAAKSEIEFDLSKQVESGEMILFRVPFHVITLEDGDGNIKTKLVGPSSVITRAKEKNAPIPEILEPLSPHLQELASTSPAFDKSRMAAGVRGIEGIGEKAQSLINKAVSYLKESGMSNDLANKIQQLYGPSYRDWQPDLGLIEGGTEA